VLDTFEALVNPQRPIPLAVQTLTGIGDADVAGAPLLGAIAGEIEAFLVDGILVGHNVLGFDTQFLETAGVRHRDVVYDTQELATLLLPGLSEYGLAALSAHLGIAFPVHHRALGDAEAARLLFLALRERALSLPLGVLDQAAQWLTPTAWPFRSFFRQVWESASIGGAAVPALARKLPRLPEPLMPRPRIRRIEEEETLAVLSAAAERRDLFPDFDERSEQQAMVGAVAKALNEEQRLIVEAGTGTGKSLAYLIPAACHALANGDRVVVSTNTINLQEQLAKKDIPTVQELMPSGDGELRACQLKGRRNYLCVKRFEALRSEVNLSDDEALLATRILIWLGQTETGDRAELRISQGEERVWRSLSADGADCTASNSAYVVDGSCFLQRARRTAEGSHIVVVNHSLLLSDTLTGGMVVPRYERLIIDEAHHLEEEATRQYGFVAGERAVVDLLDRCEALPARVQTGLRGLTSALGPQSELTSVAGMLRQSATATRGHTGDFFQTLTGFLREQSTETSERDDRLLINRSMRVQPDWPDAEIAWENLRLGLNQVTAQLKQLHSALGAEGAAEMPNYEHVRAEVDNLLQDSQALVAGLSAAIEEDDPGRIVWLESERSDGTLTVSSAPLVVSDLLGERLFADRKSIVLTGATLRSHSGTSILSGEGLGTGASASLGAGFGYIQERLGLEDAETLALGSPFDFKRAALVLTPTDMPEPGRPQYIESLGRAICDLGRAAGGRTLVLFTSHADLRAARQVTQEVLGREGINVLGQGIDGSARQLTRALQASDRTVLLGAASFWEGVDIPGDSLSVLIIARLPFGVPTEPVTAARSALYDDAFNQYMLPQAILRFRQGFGRLIRSKTDRGVVVVLDRRIVSKRYGVEFLESLPGCGVREAALREMPDMVERWLGAAVSS
jgi:DNA polymerase-3 subunit epsilon/ATP-dependent DNA helicase DinG